MIFRRRQEQKLRPSTKQKHREPLAPANTSPIAVAAALDKVMEARQARSGQHRRVADRASPLPAFPPFPTARPSVPTPASAELFKPPQVVHPASRRPARAPAETDFAVQPLPAQAALLKNSRSGFLKGLMPERVPAAVAGREDETIGRHFERDLAGELRRGGRVLLAATLFALMWAGFVPLSGAVIIAGSLVVQSSVKKVQHPAGGVVSAIFVHNGSKVNAGDELLRLDTTQAHANLQVVARQLDESRLRIARLNAERDGSEPHWPIEMSAELSTTERSRLLASEQDIFAQRAGARRGQQALAESRVKQLEKQILGLEAQLASNRTQMTITAKELHNVEKLLEEKLVTMERLTALQREAARLEGIDGQVSSQIAETRNKINEARLQGIQTDESFRSEVMRDLGDAEAKEGELIERKAAAEDQAKRTIIQAPATGTIQELAVHTVGGFVSAGEVMMVIVPQGDALEIDARLSPDKIDQVHAGQAAHVRLSAFNARTTPELTGVVDNISADLVRDSQSSAGHYDIKVSLPATEVSRLGKLQLVPGMPAEVFLQTGSRTMLSYLFKPMTDQLSRMFRER
jgi:HlyD family secretion protein